MPQLVPALAVRMKEGWESREGASSCKGRPVPTSGPAELGETEEGLGRASAGQGPAARPGPARGTHRSSGARRPCWRSRRRLR